jgi:L-fuculose-phosphate aldolase
MQDLKQLKRDICEIGDRIYKRGFAAANDGNISVRLNENEVLCTPTMHCKGFLKPKDICLVDMEGNQIAGKKKRSSEVLLHLEIMKARPDVESVVHCHPPHATAFAVAREPIPQAVLPEVEVFLGEVPIAPYETPGGKRFAETILPFVKHSNVIILANHGTVSFGESVERAFWWTEVLDAYCRILILARQLGPIQYLSAEKTQELLDLKAKWGFTDQRLAEGFSGDIRDNATFRHTWDECNAAPRAFAPPGANGES